MSEFNPQPPDPRLVELLAGYPPGLFTDTLYRSIELADRYGLELAADLADRLGVLERLETWHSVPALCQELGFDRRFAAALTWLLERLAAAGRLAVRETDGIRHYRTQGSGLRAEPAAWRAVGLAIDPANAATLNLLDAAAAAYPALARSETSGEEALLGMGNIQLWLEYFNNRNPLYAINNWVSALAAADRLADRPALRILELGAGAGSASEALLSVLTERRLSGRIERYRITEPSPFLRRRGERELKAKYRHLPLEFGALDIDKPWDGQEAARGGFDLVYGVNVLHVARDLLFSLGEARATLAPNGWLVAGECLRPFPGQPVYVELIFQLLTSFTDVTLDPELRPVAGFLTPEQWCRAFAKAGFAHCQVVPDHERIRRVYSRFYIGALCGG